MDAVPDLEDAQGANDSAVQRFGTVKAGEHDEPVGWARLAQANTDSVAALLNKRRAAKGLPGATARQHQASSRRPLEWRRDIAVLWAIKGRLPCRGAGSRGAHCEVPGGEQERGRCRNWLVRQGRLVPHR